MQDTRHHGLDPQLITMTGMVVMWWGRVEHLLFTDLLDLRRDPGVAEAKMLDRISIGTKSLIRQWTKAATVAAQSEDALVAEIKNLESELLDVAEDRHVIVHGFWPYPGKDAPSEVRLTTMKPNKDGDILLRQYDVDTSLVESIAGRAQTLYHRILPITFNRLIRQNRPKEVLERVKLDRREPQ